MERAKELINEFCRSEYGHEADYTDLERIGVAYTTVGDDEEIERQIYIDLINYQMLQEDNGEIVNAIMYDTLDELIENELEVLDFNWLIFR